jgi:hypothetical protein
VRIFPSALAALVVLACSACAPDGLAFRADKRLTILAPEDEAEVSLPLTLRWQMKDFDVVEPGTPVHEGAGYFAVFIDQTPPSPGENVRTLAKGDLSCDPAAGCPDAKYLAERDVYVTTDTELVLTELPERTGRAASRHKATIILLDGKGTRIGESSFKVDFEVRQGAQS